MEDIDSIPISSLNQFAFCPRRCALIHIEGIFIDNEHTVTGSLLHDRADTPGYENDTKTEIAVLRALPLFSKKYGLTGKADIVEMHGKQPVPVEYKKGRRKQWDNDDIQLCAQALCLEEMFNAEVPKGFIYHAASKRRREVMLTQKLRDETLGMVEKVREMLRAGQVSSPVLKPQCEGCSLHKVCMPEMSGAHEKKCGLNIWSE